jgi:diacylglycerol O-acyltransferase
LRVLYPVVPLGGRQALGIAVMSYDGHLGFGLLGDFDALPELESIAKDLEWAISALARAAGIRPPAARRPKKGNAGSRKTPKSARRPAAKRAAAR